MKKLSQQPVRAVATLVVAGATLQYGFAVIQNPANPPAEAVPLGAITAISTAGDTGPLPETVMNQVTEVEYALPREDLARFSISKST